MSKKFPRVLAIAGLIAVLPALAFAMGEKPNNTDDEALNARIQPVAKVKLAPAQAGGAATAGSRSGEELYKAVCAACHETGVAESPKMGDKAAWAPRIGVGLDVLVKSAKAGKNAMPPKGGSDATDEELARVVTYIANKSGANFK
jgi:cytochrome c5